LAAKKAFPKGATDTDRDWILVAFRGVDMVRAGLLFGAVFLVAGGCQLAGDMVPGGGAAVRAGEAALGVAKPAGATINVHCPAAVESPTACGEAVSSPVLSPSPPSPTASPDTSYLDIFAPPGQVAESVPEAAPEPECAPMSGRFEGFELCPKKSEDDTTD